MSRERYDVQIKCPDCNQTGILRVSENDYPFMKNIDRRVTITGGNFEAKMINDNDARIVCKSCDAEFQW